MQHSRAFIMVAALLCGAVEASAQSVYVGASVFADVVRTSGTSTFGSNDASGGGEAIGFTVRVGTGLGPRWGVEAEFARPSEIEDNDRGGVFPLPAAFTTVAAGPGLSLPSPLFPPLTYRNTLRNTTISTSAWVRQEISPRASLVYTGGLGFYRSQHTFELAFDPRALIGGVLGLSILPFNSQTVVYGVRPFAGLEARIGMGEHAQLVPGVRLHGIDQGWLLRPGVGLNWVF